MPIPQLKVRSISITLTRPCSCSQVTMGGKYQLPSGAHHAESLIRAFRQVEAEGGATGSAFAAALSIPDEVMAEMQRGQLPRRVRLCSSRR